MTTKKKTAPPAPPVVVDIPVNHHRRAVIRIPAEVAYKFTLIGVLNDPPMRASDMITDVLADYLRKNPPPTLTSLKAEKAAKK